MAPVIGCPLGSIGDHVSYTRHFAPPTFCILDGDIVANFPDALYTPGMPCLLQRCPVHSRDALSTPGMPCTRQGCPVYSRDALYTPRMPCTLQGCPVHSRDALYMPGISPFHNFTQGLREQLPLSMDFRILMYAIII